MTWLLIAAAAAAAVFVWLAYTRWSERKCEAPKCRSADRRRFRCRRCGLLYCGLHTALAIPEGGSPASATYTCALCRESELEWERQETRRQAALARERRQARRESFVPIADRPKSSLQYIREGIERATSDSGDPA